MHERLCDRTVKSLCWLYDSLKEFSLELHDDRFWRFNFYSKQQIQALIKIIIEQQLYQGDLLARHLPLEQYIELTDDSYKPDFLYSMDDCVVFMNSRMLLDMFEKHRWCTGMSDYGLPSDIKRTVFPPAYERGLFQPPPPYSERDPKSKCTIL